MKTTQPAETTFPAAPHKWVREHTLHIFPSSCERREQKRGYTLRHSCLPYYLLLHWIPYLHWVQQLLSVNRWSQGNHSLFMESSNIERKKGKKKKNPKPYIIELQSNNYGPNINYLISNDFPKALNFWRILSFGKGKNSLHCFYSSHHSLEFFQANFKCWFIVPTVGIIYQGTSFPQQYCLLASEQREHTSNGAIETSWAVLWSHCIQSMLRKILLSCKANKTRKKSL